MSKPTSKGKKGALTVANSIPAYNQDRLSLSLAKKPSISERFTGKLGKLGDVFVEGRRDQQSEAKKESAAENAKKVSAAREKAAEKKELAEEKKAKNRTEFLEQKAKYKEEIAKKLAENKAKDDARKAKLKERVLGKKKSEEPAELDWEDEFSEESSDDRAYTPPPRAYAPLLDENGIVLAGGDLDSESSSDEELSEVEDARQKKREIFKELDEESLVEEEVRKKLSPSLRQLKLERDRENTPPKKEPVRKNLHWTPTILSDIEEVKETSIEEDRKNVFDRVFAAIEDNLSNKFGKNHEVSFDNIRKPFEEAWMKTMKMGRILKKQDGGIEEALNVMWPGFAIEAGDMFFSLNPKEIEDIGGIFTDAQANAMAEICFGVRGFEIEIENREQRISKQNRKLILGVVKELRNEIIAPTPSNRPLKTRAGKARQETKYDGPSYV